MLRAGISVVTTLNIQHLESLHDIVERATAVRVKGRNLLRDPRAALHVAGRDFFNFAVAECDVVVAEAKTPGDAATDELTRCTPCSTAKRSAPHSTSA